MFRPSPPRVPVVVAVRVFSVLMTLVVFSVPVWTEIFTFKYVEGQKYRILSEVDQNLYLNGTFSHNADLLNRILITVQKVEGNRAFHTVEYHHSVEARYPNQIYQYGASYDSEFWRDAQGRYTMSPGYYVPVVRNVPLFTTQDYKPGDSWAANGSEVHDLSSLGVPEAFEFPIPVSYQYQGKAMFEGKEYDLILINYNIFHRSNKQWPDAIYPVLISGYSKQRMYWDNTLGRPYYYDEEYLIMMTLSTGEQVGYEGTARARVIDVPDFDETEAAKDIQEQVDRLNIPDVHVRQDEEGITISVENIQFAPDSALLLPGEKEKLDRIAEILAAYKGTDLLITGHTALAGTEQGRQELSEDRARVVGQYLLEKKVRERDEMMFQGRGATEPVADNDTEQGKARNRRVEITILNH